MKNDKAAIVLTTHSLYNKLKKQFLQEGTPKKNECTQIFLAKIDKMQSWIASWKDATLVTVGFSPRNKRDILPLSL